MTRISSAISLIVCLFKESSAAAEFSSFYESTITGSSPSHPLVKFRFIRSFNETMCRTNHRLAAGASYDDVIVVPVGRLGTLVVRGKVVSRFDWGRVHARK